MRMKISELAHADLTAVAALTHDMQMQPIDNEHSLTRSTLDAFDSHSSLCLVAHEGEELIGFAFGARREKQGIVRLFGVKTEHRRKGIATALLDELEKRLAEEGATSLAVDGIAPGWLFPGVEITRTAAISLLMQRGYKTDRNARIDMLVDLTLSANTALSFGSINGEFELRRAAAEDREAIRNFVDAHFGKSWVTESSAAFDHEPISMFLATKDSQIVSFAVYDVTGPRRFGPTGTHPDMRGQGLGSALMRMCMHDMAARGDTTCEIVWVGPIAYYARTLGARIHRAYWTFNKELR